MRQTGVLMHGLLLAADTVCTLQYFRRRQPDICVGLLLLVEKAQAEITEVHNQRDKSSVLWQSAKLAGVAGLAASDARQSA